MNIDDHGMELSPMKRVVITGMGGITPLGHDWSQIESRLREGRNAVRKMPEWDFFDSLNSRLGCPVDDFKLPDWPRKHLRSMGRVAQLAVAASERALRDAGLHGDPNISDGRMGVAYGSSGGSIEPVRVMGRMLETGSMQGVTATSYVQMMAHTTAVNVGVFFGLKGRICRRPVRARRGVRRSVTATKRSRRASRS
jgi:3-oxoacyl-[acyl-carrier-protein] synthase II